MVLDYLYIRNKRVGKYEETKNIKNGSVLKELIVYGSGFNSSLYTVVKKMLPWGAWVA